MLRPAGGAQIWHGEFRFVLVKVLCLGPALAIRLAWEEVEGGAGAGEADPNQSGS
jgi:hypothetical protein